MIVARRDRAIFVQAGVFWRPTLHLLGAAAITMPWRRIYALREHFDDEILRRHEMIHIEQIERDGAVVFSLRYLCWLARYGDRQNPYEIEAYAREKDPAPSQLAKKVRRVGNRRRQ